MFCVKIGKRGERIQIDKLIFRLS